MVMVRFYSSLHCVQRFCLLLTGRLPFGKMCAVSEYLLEGVEETGRRLGGGGFASVFLAKWRSCNVAIKRLHPAFMGLDSDNLPTKEFVDFMAEFRTLRKLAHPSIAQVFGLVKPSTPAESYGVVMEVLAMSLKERYAKMPPLTVGDESV